MTKAIQRTKLPISICRGPLKFGDVTGVETHVLDNDMRVLTQTGAVAILTGARPEKGGLERYLDRIPNKPEGFEVVPIEFRIPGGSNGRGITADDFATVVQLYLEAYLADALHPTQRAIGERCVRIAAASMRSTFRQLIDEATGYREFSHALELKRRIAAYLLPAPSEWTAMFPAEFNVLLCKVFRVELRGAANPRFGGWFIHEFVYSYLDPDVAAAVKERNPNPKFGSNHHQHYNTDGRQLVSLHINRVMGVLRQSRDRDDFYMRFAVEFKGAGLQHELNLRNN